MIRLKIYAGLCNQADISEVYGMKEISGLPGTN